MYNIYENANAPVMYFRLSPKTRTLHGGDREDTRILFRYRRVRYCDYEHLYPAKVRFRNNTPTEGAQLGERGEGHPLKTH